MPFTEPTPTNPNVIKANVISRLDSVKNVAAPHIREADSTLFKLKTATHAIDINDRLGEPGLAVGFKGDESCSEDPLGEGYEKQAYFGVFYPGYIGGTYDTAIISREQDMTIMQHGSFDQNTKRQTVGFNFDTPKGQLYVNLKPDKTGDLKIDMITSESETGEMPELMFTNNLRYRLLARHKGKNTGKIDEAMNMLTKAGISVKLDDSQLTVVLPGSQQRTIETSQLNLDYFLGKALELGNSVIKDIEAEKAG